MNPKNRHFWSILRAGLAGGILGCLASVGPGRSDVAGAGASAIHSYDIPAQNLATALDLYAATSGLQVLYESSLVNGRQSATVKGMLSPAAALQKLLVGTGLAGRMIDIDAVTIAAKPDEQAHVPSGPELQFVGGIQSSIAAALCKRMETRLRNYRVAVQLWIADYGEIRRVAVLGTTGDFRVDDAVTQALQKLDLGMRPPPGLPQPLTIAISQPRPGQAPACPDR